MKKILIPLIISTLFISPALFLKSTQKIEKVEGTAPTYNIPLEAGEELDYDNAFFDGFDNGINPSNWYINDRVWGQNDGKDKTTGVINPDKVRENGGVVDENVFYDSSEGSVILRATGDQYAEKNITPATNAVTRGGRRTGADLVSVFQTYPGRYEVRMKPLPRYGACTSLWTYIEYNTKFGSDYNNHEIDIELPWNGDFKKISLGNYAGLNESDPDMHWSEKALLDSPINDGEYHTFGFDWYYNNNTGNKLINYYMDGEILCTITRAIPFYKTKVNIGVWIPNSNLAGRLPRFDTAYMDIDYFKYIPFKNNLHIDSDKPGVYDYGVKMSGNTYPSVSTPIPASQRNYFPNGTFNYVNKRSESEWLDESITGLVSENVSIAKAYDYNSSSTSGGASLTANTGHLAGYIDSCFKGQKYHLTTKYKYGGTATIQYFNANDELIDSSVSTMEQSNDWTTFSQNVTVINGTSYIGVRFDAGSNGMWLDNIYLTLGEREITPTHVEKNHFMSIFHNNPSVLSAYETAKDTTSSRKQDVVISNMDNSSEISWKISDAKYESKASDYCGSITMGSASVTIEGSSDPNYSSIRAAVANSEALSGHQSVIHTTSYIENLKDVSLSWSSVEAGTIYVVYKIVGESGWKYLSSYSALSNNDGSGDKNTYNRRQLILDNSNEDFIDKLLGEDAYIGFMFSSNHSNLEVSYIRLQSIIINKVESIKAKIDVWSNDATNLCGVGGKFTTPKSCEYFDLLMTSDRLSVKQANEMNVAMPTGGAAKEATYFNQYVYLCNAAGINVNVTPTNVLVSSFNIPNSNVFVFIIAASTLTIVLIGTLLIKKKRYNH